MMLALDFFLYLLPALSLSIWAQVLIWRARAAAARVPSAAGYSGAQAAAMLMNAAGVAGVRVEPADSEPGDHYDPRRKVLYLSEGAYAGSSLASLGVAAHEAGHAIQHSARYPALFIRNLIVPLAAIGSITFWVIVLSGFLIGMTRFVMAGVVLFWLTLLLQLINLPIEFDASRRGRKILEATGFTHAGEDEVVAKVLTATAWTHVAATLTGFFTFVYSLFPLRVRATARGIIGEYAQRLLR
jgi:Zn-dependent membrane protease YugP